MKFSANASLIFVAAILLAACGAKSSDEEQVRALIDAVETAAEARDTSDVLEHVADDYADSHGFDKTQLQNFLRGYFLAHPKVELLVNIESLEFPVDGLAQASHLRRHGGTYGSRPAAPEGRVPPFGKRLAGGARRPRGSLTYGQPIVTMRHFLTFNPNR